MVLDENIINAVASKLGLSKRDIIARPLKTEVLVVDATQKILIYTKNDKQPKMFVLVSSAKTPLAVKSAYDKLGVLAKKIGERLAKNLLIPLEIGESNGLTYSISAYHRPLYKTFIAKQMDLWRIRQLLINWVIDVAAVTKKPATTDEINDSFKKPLLALSLASGLKQEYKSVALQAIEAINQNNWQPCFVCAHNDLWLGNVLSSHETEFLLIDWDGAMLKGYAFYDLMRVVSSLMTSKSDFKYAFQQYCNVMGCNSKDAQYYLISAFAYLYSDLGGWQYDRFLLLLDDCMLRLSKFVSSN